MKSPILYKGLLCVIILVQVQTRFRFYTTVSFHTTISPPLTTNNSDKNSENPNSHLREVSEPTIDAKKPTNWTAKPGVENDAISGGLTIEQHRSPKQTEISAAEQSTTPQISDKHSEKFALHLLLLIILIAGSGCLVYTWIGPLVNRCYSIENVYDSEIGSAKVSNWKYSI